MAVCNPEIDLRPFPVSIVLLLSDDDADNVAAFAYCRPVFRYVFGLVAEVSERTRVTAHEYGLDLLAVAPVADDLSVILQIESRSTCEWLIALPVREACFDWQQVDLLASLSDLPPVGGLHPLALRWLSQPPDEARDRLAPTVVRRSAIRDRLGPLVQSLQSPASTLAPSSMPQPTRLATPESGHATPSVDVIILSYAKSPREYGMTANCLDSLISSERTGFFRVVVVETNSPDAVQRMASVRLFERECQVVFPQEPFNYNRFLQFGFQALGGSSAPYLLILNNDVICHAGFASALIDALQEFDSASPWCPGYHERHFDGDQPCYVGIRTSLEVCGWAIMFRKELLNRISFVELFPSDFAFWFQDNYYITRLERLGLRHALVTSARVRHLFEQSHGLIDPTSFHEMTIGAQSVFERKALATTPVCQLTIAIPSIPARSQSLFPSLFQKLADQAKGKPVEVIAMVDNLHSSLGAKRNQLAAAARGRFLAFVDDDDDVASDYVDALVAQIARSPDADCIVFDAWVAIDGQPDRVCHYGHEFDDVNRDDAYYRRPNHVCCFRTSLVMACPRQDITWGEDARWPEQVRPQILEQARINRVLYYYRCNPATSACRRAVELPPKQRTLLTVGVLSVPARLGTDLPTLFAKLDRQAAGKPVEILVFADNHSRTIGDKRNIVLHSASGEYLAFVDDDDDVSDDYVDALLTAAAADPAPDCIVFDALVTQDGGPAKLCRYGIEFDDEDRADVHLRAPNHICCICRKVSLQVPFEPLNWHEDFRWSAALRGRLVRQVRVPRVLYHYRFDSQRSEAANPHRKFHSSSARDAAIPAAPMPTDARRTIEQTADASSITVSPSLSPEPLIYGFWHIAAMNHWRDVVAEQWFKLRVSGLVDRSQKLFVTVLGLDPESFPIRHPKIEIAYASPRLEEAEFPTLAKLHAFSARQDGYVYFLHTKGVGRPSASVRDWRMLMEYFNIIRFDDCLRALATHDVCGVNWHRSPFPHFSGNFWWARCDYLRRLPTLESLTAGESWWHSDRQLGERWIGSVASPHVACLHESHVNHYEQPYRRSLYARRFDKADSATHVNREWTTPLLDALESTGAIRLVAAIGLDYPMLSWLSEVCRPAAVLSVDAPIRRQRPFGYPPEAKRVDFHGRHRSAEADRVDESSTIIELDVSAEAAAQCICSQVDVLCLDGRNYDDETLGQTIANWHLRLRPGACVIVFHAGRREDRLSAFLCSLGGRQASLREPADLVVWHKPIAGERFTDFNIASRLTATELSSAH